MSESQEIDHPRVWWKEAVKRRRVRRFSAALVGGPRHRDYLVDARDAPRPDRAGLQRGRQRPLRRARPRPPGATPTAAGACPTPRTSSPSAGSSPRRTWSGWSARSPAIARPRRGRRPGTWSSAAAARRRRRSRRPSRRAACAGSIHRPGFLQADELARWYAYASAFVHPSLMEPWGLVVNEAAACGLPLLVSDRAGCVETLVPDGRRDDRPAVRPARRRRAWPPPSPGSPACPRPSAGRWAAGPRRSSPTGGPSGSPTGTIEALQIASWPGTSRRPRSPDARAQLRSSNSRFESEDDQPWRSSMSATPTTAASDATGRRGPEVPRGLAPPLQRARPGPRRRDGAEHPRDDRGPGGAGGDVTIVTPDAVAARRRPPIPPRPDAPRARGRPGGRRSAAPRSSTSTGSGRGTPAAGRGPRGRRASPT